VVFSELLCCLLQALTAHPRDNSAGDPVEMDVFWSMWRSRTVAARPQWGAHTPGPAPRTILLHHEQFKNPREPGNPFPLKHGMWGFVKKLASAVPRSVQARRKRVEPYANDPEADNGAGAGPNPPLRHGLHHHSDSVLSLASMDRLQQQPLQRQRVRQ